jgi:transcriptional regulator with XRE-family HTH domain
MANESFGEFVRKSRRASNKSLQEVADALQVTPVYVSEVERGKRPPFVTTRLPALAQVLNLDLTTLLRAAWAEKKMIDFDPASSSKSPAPTCRLPAALPPPPTARQPSPTSTLQCASARKFATSPCS